MRTTLTLAVLLASALAVSTGAGIARAADGNVPAAQEAVQTYLLNVAGMS